MAEVEIIIYINSPNLAPTRFASPSIFSVPITFVFIVCQVNIPLQVSLSMSDTERELSKMIQERERPQTGHNITICMGMKLL